MASPKEVTSITKVADVSPGLPLWSVRYVGSNGLTYWRQVHAKDEMDAYMQVMGVKRT